jgi:EF-P beta-lysylation protein EpmB
MTTTLAAPVPLWRQIQRENFTDWKKLVNFLQLDTKTAEAALLTHCSFPLNLPLRLAKKIRLNCWNDPILIQFLPLKQEEEESPLFVLDPVEDKAFRKTPKLLHKYHSRALLLSTSACAMHCRYCFRRHFDYETSDKQFEKELEEIRLDSSLSEILLSGGDPLSLSNRQLEEILKELDKIPHLKRIRFHTRFPLGIPERVDADFLKLLKSCKKQIIFVIHCNHAQEFDKEIIESLRCIQLLGIPILSQSVLLKGVNDHADVLEELFLLLIDNGILPYYLHQLDRVQGSQHFEVPETIGKELIKELQKRLPGYAVPKYVKEEAHLPHKTVVTSCQES